jgi:hypothetical protein
MNSAENTRTDEPVKPDAGFRAALKASELTIKREQAHRLGTLERRMAKIKSAPIRDD